MTSVLVALAVEAVRVLAPIVVPIVVDAITTGSAQ